MFVCGLILFLKHQRTEKGVDGECESKKGVIIAEREDSFWVDSSMRCEREKEREIDRMVISVDS